MERKRPSTRLPAWAAAVLVAALGAFPAALSGCGAGVYDGRGDTQVTKTIPIDGDQLVLGQARLVIGPGTLAAPTAVTLRRIPAIAHAGAYGPVFQINVPTGSLFRQDARFELFVPFIGENQPRLALGSLDSTQMLDVQQWVPISSSVLDADQTQVTAAISRFANLTALQLAAVVQCLPTTTCPAGQACNSNACQMCPTGSTCP